MALECLPPTVLKLILEVCDDGLTHEYASSRNQCRPVRASARDSVVADATRHAARRFPGLERPGYSHTAATRPGRGGVGPVSRRNTQTLLASLSEPLEMSKIWCPLRGPWGSEVGANLQTGVHYADRARGFA